MRSGLLHINKTRKFDSEQGEGGDVDILRSAHLVLDDGADDAAVAENIVHADAGLHADADDALQVKVVIKSCTQNTCIFFDCLGGKLASKYLILVFP